ncbi:MAG: DUF1549 and DUF1553 domain-containing protein [Pirellulales bacterium]|nr:DUF1549 and DUF1553 domain-containing protein [Pirellulales bacterium]
MDSARSMTEEQPHKLKSTTQAVLFVLLCVAGIGGLVGSAFSTKGLERRVNQIDNHHQQAAGLLEVVAEVDQQFQQQWKERSLPFAPAAHTLTVMRRASLALHGTIPSLEEVKAFALESGYEMTGDKVIDRYVNYLLMDRRYSDYLSERFARIFVGVDAGPFLIYRRGRFRLWLSDQLMDNKPYDELVHSLIDSKGVWTSDPEVNFVTAAITEGEDGRPDVMKLAGRTSRAFLGMRIDCLQCHDDRLGTITLNPSDPAEGGLQSDFHQFAAFYSQVKTGLYGVDDDAEHYAYKYLGNEEEVIVPPVVPFFQELSDSKGTRRGQLADWVTHPDNRAFARTAVNRIWAIVFGRPLVVPVDDIPLAGPFPLGLEALTDEFVESGFDLKHLIRVITRLQVFRLDSRADFEVTEAHEAVWSVFPLVRLRPEQVAGALNQTASLQTINADVSYLIRLQQQNEINNFVKRYGDTGEDEFEDRGGTVTQRLLLMNGNLSQSRIANGNGGNASARISRLTEDDEDAIRAAYLTVLTRSPSQAELLYFLKKFREKPDAQRGRVIEDLFWTLTNSTEFSWSH